MDNFLIITNKEKDPELLVTKKIAATIENAGKKAILADRFPLGQGCRLPEDAECAIVLGGDGTIIQTANDLMAYDIPILGVNMGTLGFLAEIEEHHVPEALNRLFYDDYRTEDRMMMEGTVYRRRNSLFQVTDALDKGQNTQAYALNDVVITRKGFSRIISLGIYVNGILVDNFRGDGVIISTPTGSTAYNLSAGGPIVMAQAGVMVITPICPHSLSPRSVVVSSEDTIKVIVGKSKKTQEAEAIATFDGGRVMDLGTDDVILMKKSRYSTKLIKLNHTGIYEILRAKLGRDGAYGSN